MEEGHGAEVEGRIRTGFKKEECVSGLLRPEAMLITDNQLPTTDNG